MSAVQLVEHFSSGSEKNPQKFYSGHVRLDEDEFISTKITDESKKSKQNRTLKSSLYKI